VHNYVERSSNHKNLELTFVKAESRRELLKAIFKSSASTDIGDHDPESFLRASSIEQAKQFSSSYTRDPILIGGKKSVLMASSSIPGLEFQGSDIIATTCRSILFHKCQQGNSIILEKTTSREDLSVATVLRISDIFIVKHSGKEHLFIKGELYSAVPENDTHMYSSCKIVQPTSNSVVYPANRLLRKVMLYPDLDNLDSPNCYIVVDYDRPFVPIIIVPAYPMSGDMVLVNGDTDELWHAHVIAVNHSNKTKIQFYVEDHSCPGRYKRETFGRSSITETIHWNTIVRQASGCWEETFWKDL